MFGKRRTLALAIATAGLIGMSATMASAAATPGGDAAGLLNLSHNQVPVQLCNDYVPVNVIGVQVPADGLAGALGILSPRGTTIAHTDTSCHQKALSADNNSRHAVYHVMSAPMTSPSCPTSCGSAPGYGAAPSTVIVNHDGSHGDWGGLVNVSDNELPIQACNISVPVNGIGVQVPLQHIVGGVALLSPAGNTTANDDSSCHSTTAQANNNG
jgi:hypothetical protein